MRWGAPRFVTGAYLQDWLLLPTDWNWRLDPDEAGALRAVADIGSHWLDLARFVTGRRVEQVLADLHTLVPVRRRPTGPVEAFAAAGDDEERVEVAMTSDDAAGILLRLEGGARGLVAISQVSAGRKNTLTLEVDGAEAALAWRSEEPDDLWIGHRGRPNEILKRDPALLAPAARATTAYPAGHVEGYPDTFRALFAAIYADVAAGGAGGRARVPDLPGRPREHAGGRGRGPERPGAALGDRRAGGSGMRLGLLTAAFPGLSLEEVADWAAANGFGALEIACWPRQEGAARRYAGVTHIDVDALDDAGAARIRGDARRARPGDLGPGLLPQPPAPGPGRARAGQRAPEDGHRRRAAAGRGHRGHLRRAGTGPAACPRAWTSSPGPGRRWCASPPSTTCASPSRTAR